MGGRSYSRSPPPRGGGGGGYGRRRSPSPRGRHGGGRDRDLPTSLLVRNLRRDCRPEDLRRPFGQFGPLKDVYLPRDYYSGIKTVRLNRIHRVLKIPYKFLEEPRGFGFVQFVDPADAAEAKYQMDGQIMQGREVTVVFAEENRKKPVDMRARERSSSARSRGHDRRRSPPRYSRSPPPRRGRSRSRSPIDNYDPAPRRRQHSRSVSPQEKRRSSRGRAYSGSPPPAAKASRSPSRSPVRSRSRSPGGDYGRQARERSVSQ